MVAPFPLNFNGYCMTNKIVWGLQKIKFKIKDNCKKWNSAGSKR